MLNARTVIARTALVATAVATMLVGTASTASAAGFLGACHPTHAGNWGGGWCDGNGPDWTYRAAVMCNYNPGTWYVASPSHWAGDRGSLYSYCSTSNGATHGALFVYDVGILKYIYTD